MKVYTCANCGRQFFDKGSRRRVFCSRPCRWNRDQSRIPPEERFWKKIDKNGPEIIPGSPCWIWTKHCSNKGYGIFMIGDGQAMSAHRYSWTIRNGPVPDGLCVLHRCDVRHCVNPDHLWLGTNADNSRDMSEKNRHRVPMLRGEDVHGAKLNPEKVLEVCRLYDEGLTCAEIARRFDMTHKGIRLILDGKNWRHITRGHLPVRSRSRVTN